MSTFKNSSNYEKNRNSTESGKSSVALIILLFFLLFVILGTIIFLRTFSLPAKNVKSAGSSYSNIKVATADTAQKSQPVTQPETSTQQQETKEETKAETQQQTAETKPDTKTETETKTETKTETQTAQQPQTTVKQDGYYVNSANIKKYHDILLKNLFGDVKSTVDYKVKWGDTLWKIAMKYNTTAHTIYVYNALDDPDLILVGQNIKIPKNKKIMIQDTNKTIIEAMQNNKTGMNTSSSVANAGNTLSTDLSNPNLNLCIGSIVNQCKIFINSVFDLIVLADEKQVPILA